MAVELREVLSPADLRTFVRFPFSLYRDNDYWIPPLIRSQLDTLRRDRNPAFEHCDAVYYLAYSGGRPVGRIAGIINHRFIEIWDRNFGRFNWFDFIDDVEVSGTLLGAVEEWARSRGIEGLHGPMGFSTFEAQGVLIHGFDELPTFASVYNHPYYPEHLEKHGYSKDVDYVEYEVKIPNEIPEKAQRINDITVKRNKLKFLEAKSRNDLAAYAHQVFDVINAAYSPLFGFVPLTPEQVEHLTKQNFSFLDPQYTTVVLDQSNRVVGFQISVPSLSRAFQKARGRLFPFGWWHLRRAMVQTPERIDILLVGILPEYQNKGVNALFMTDMTKYCYEKGIRYAESNAELEENIKVQNFWRYYDARQHKRRRIYQKAL